jgi:hypothetical protein
LTKSFNSGIFFLRSAYTSTFYVSLLSFCSCEMRSWVRQGAWYFRSSRLSSITNITPQPHAPSPNIPSPWGFACHWNCCDSRPWLADRAVRRTGKTSVSDWNLLMFINCCWVSLYDITRALLVFLAIYVVLASAWYPRSFNCIYYTYLIAIKTRRSLAQALGLGQT